MTTRSALLAFTTGAVLTAIAVLLLFPSPATGLPETIPIGDGMAARVTLEGGATPWMLALIAGMGGVGALLAYVLGTVSKRPAPALIRALHPDARGQAIVEFALVFPVLLVTMLAIAQMALMYNAKNVVLYSSYAAARSAIVWIPKDTGDEMPGEINQSILSEKMRNIQLAAAYANVPISQRASWVLADLGSFGAGLEAVVVFIDALLSYIPLASELFDYADRFAYAYALTWVWLGETSNEAGSFTAAGWPFEDLDFPDPHGDVSVQVVHQFYMVVPLVNRIIGAETPTPIEFFWLDLLGSDDHFTTIRATCTLTLEGQDPPS